MTEGGSIDPGLRVIAVFGANKPDDGELKAARLLAEAIQRAGAVVLSGGDGSDWLTTKDAAIGAARCSALSRNVSPAWIGVANKKRQATAVWHGPSSVVVTPGWEHRRNFVEACLCDAAFAVGGMSEGTASEAFFCLYLRRPLVIVGSLSAAELTPAALARVASNRVPDRGAGARLAVDDGIHRAHKGAAAAATVADIQPLPKNRKRATELVNNLLAEVKTTSPRLDYNAVATEKGWDKYVQSCLDRLPSPARMT